MSTMSVEEGADEEMTAHRVILRHIVRERMWWGACPRFWWELFDEWTE